MSGGCGPVCIHAGLLSCAFADPSTLPATTWAFNDHGQLPGQAFSIIAPT